MPLRPRLATTLVAACLALAALVGASPAPASALEPPRPLPGYRPHFVTEKDQRPFKDCLWAAGAMLLDKWTNGELRYSHQHLRTLSGDHAGGSQLADLRAAYARVGIHLRFSPDGGVRITWGMLLDRLARGAGAVVLGDDSDFPRYLGRWDPGFWDNKGAKDNHAVYVERYNRRTGRVWLMDPLATGDWQGQWIRADDLRRFAWSRGGALFAAITPTAKPAPFAGVKVGVAGVAATDTSLSATWPIRYPRHWRFPGLDVRSAFERVDDAVAAAATAPVTSVASDAAAPKRPTVELAGRALHASVALPSTPGAYAATVTLTDRRFGRVVARTGTGTVFVPGTRRAALTLRTPRISVVAGGDVPISVSVENVGRDSWVQPPPAERGPSDPATGRATRLVARWVAIDAPADDAPAGESPDPVVLGTVPLAPGGSMPVSARVPAPAAAGRWALVIDLVDDVDGSFAAQGSAPAVLAFAVVPAWGSGRAIDAP